MQQSLVNRAVIILVLGVISILFYQVVQPFLQSIFIAALFAALFTPMYRWYLDHVGERPALASLLTLLTVLVFVLVPLFMVFGTVLTQALDVAQTAKPWVQQQLAEPGLITQKLEALPFYEYILPYKEQALAWLGNMTGTVSKFAVETIQAATFGTFSALLSLIIILYTMFFFLIDGDRLLYYLLYYLPLNDADEKTLLKRFTSVTRATLKGTAVIGILQGVLAGLALHFAGIPSALFWAVVMMFLSVVPGIGTALVWGPAVIYLVASGEYLVATLLAVYCIIVVGSIDNVLRPKLVGNDTRLHELMIFFSTLGGILLFGFMGFVIGPIIAALFVTMWELYGLAFSKWLPTTAFKPRSGEIGLPHQKMIEVDNRRENDRRHDNNIQTAPNVLKQPQDKPAQANVAAESAGPSTSSVASANATNHAATPAARNKKQSGGKVTRKKNKRKKR